MKKSHQVITIALYVVFLMVLLSILSVSIASPGNHLIPWQMLLGTVVMAVLFVLGGKLWNAVYEKIGRRTGIYLFCLTIFGVLLYVNSMGRQDSSNAFADYAQIWNAAQNLADGEPIANAYYFLVYSNNLKPMLLLSLLIRCAKLLPVTTYHFLLALNVLQVLLTVFCCGYLAEKDGDSRWRFPVLIAFVLFIPLWGMTSAFYTDSMSFGLGIICLALWKRAGKEPGRKSIPWIVLSAVVAALAAAWKITALIPVNAGILVLLWKKALRNWKPAVLFVTTFLLCMLGLNLWVNSYEVAKEAKNTANPVLSWVALGMNDDGSFSNNLAYADVLNALPTAEEKKIYTREYMRENKSSLWDKSHWKKKLARNFADGNMGVRDFLYIEYDDETLLWNCFSPWGKYWWRASEYCFCYLGAMYALLALGAAGCLRQVIHGEEPPSMLMICQLAFFGIFVFLMIWEANNRQLYNQMPGILLGGILSIDYFWRMVNTYENSK